MNNFDKAHEFYLRGFNSEYIKRRTGISMQSLLKRLKAKGITHDKSDIISYQIAYVEAHFTVDDVRQAYIHISKKYADLYKSCRGRHVECLGCAFGNYVPLFEHFLGKDEFKTLKGNCWHTKQKKIVKEKYGVDNVFQKQTFNQFVTDEAIALGRKKRNQTNLERYGVKEPLQNETIKRNMLDTLKNTNMERFGCKWAMQNRDVSRKATKTRQQTMLKKYGARNSVQIPEIRDKIFNARVNNGTLNSSFAEDALYELLVDEFGKDDVMRNVIVDNRYPYHVDFYIKPLDLFIELNGDKCHYTHWFDENNKSDVQVLNSWKENMIKLESQTNKPSRYRKYIKTWSKTDVQKRMLASKNHLHYLVFWDGSTKKKGEQKYAVLSDAREWLASGCPMPENWHKANTY